MGGVRGGEGKVWKSKQVIGFLDLEGRRRRPGNVAHGRWREREKAKDLVDGQGRWYDLVKVEGRQTCQGPEIGGMEKETRKMERLYYQ